MRGGYKTKRKLRAHLDGVRNRDRLEILHAILRLFERVERQRRRVLRRTALVIKRGVFFLEMSRIWQHDRAQIDGWLRGINRPAKALLHETWNPSTMIEVRVSQNDRINCARRNRRVLPVAFAPFFLSLKESAVDKNAKSGGVVYVVSCADKVLRTGHSAGRAEKLDVGQGFLPRKKSKVKSQIVEVKPEVSSKEFVFRPTSSI